MISLHTHTHALLPSTYIFFYVYHNCVHLPWNGGMIDILQMHNLHLYIHIWFCAPGFVFPLTIPQISEFFIYISLIRKFRYSKNVGAPFVPNTIFKYTATPYCIPTYSCVCTPQAVFIPEFCELIMITHNSFIHIKEKENRNTWRFIFVQKKLPVSVFSMWCSSHYQYCRAILFSGANSESRCYNVNICKDFSFFKCILYDTNQDNIEDLPENPPPTYHLNRVKLNLSIAGVPR